MAEDTGFSFGGLLDNVNNWLVPTKVPEGASYDPQTLQMARAALLGNIGSSLLMAAQKGQTPQERAAALAGIGQASNAYGQALQGGVDQQMKQLQLQQLKMQIAQAQKQQDFMTQGLAPGGAPGAGGQAWWETLGIPQEQAIAIARHPKGSEIVQELLKNKAKQVPGMPDPEMSATEKTLRGEFIDKTKDFASRQTAYLTMEDLAAQKEGGSDMALVLSVMKVFDPTSTVTASEAGTAAKAAGFNEQLIGEINKLTGGGALSDGARRQLVNAARQRIMREMDNYGGAYDRTTNLAKKYGVNPERVASDERDQRLYTMRQDQQLVDRLQPAQIFGLTAEQLSGIPTRVVERMSPEQQAALRTAIQAARGNMMPQVRQAPAPAPAPGPVNPNLIRPGAGLPSVMIPADSPIVTPDPSAFARPRF